MDPVDLTLHSERPDRLGRYVLERALGSGGMAEVFLAKQTGPHQFERRCVVKRVLPEFQEEPELVEMFLDEARLTAQLCHPHLVPVYDFGEEDGALFIAMEYVPGRELKDILRERAGSRSFLPLPLVARIVAQAASALDYAHHARDDAGKALHVVHRDVSPQNILVSTSGAVKLIDFGIAKAAGARLKTRAGLIKGKLAYMSPEQATTSPIDGRSDIYSLGLVLFELLSHQQAIPSGDDLVETISRLSLAAVQPIERCRPDLPDALLEVLRRSLQREPADRFERASDMSAALEHFITESGATVSPMDLARLAGVADPVPFAVLSPMPKRIADARTVVFDRSRTGGPRSPAADEPTRLNQTPSVLNQKSIQTVLLSFEPPRRQTQIYGVPPQGTAEPTIPSAEPTVISAEPTVISAEPTVIAAEPTVIAPELEDAVCDMLPPHLMEVVTDCDVDIYIEEAAPPPPRPRAPSFLSRARAFRS